jgi:hypothetical protein
MNKMGFPQFDEVENKKRAVLGPWGRNKEDTVASQKYTPVFARAGSN